jgi:hypothetical protein
MLPYLFTLEVLLVERHFNAFRQEDTIVWHFHQVSYTIFVLIVDNQLFGWGGVQYYSTSYSPGDGTSVHSNQPVLLNYFGGKTISDFSASHQSAAVLTSDGAYYSFGINTYFAVSSL